MTGLFKYEKKERKKERKKEMIYILTIRIQRRSYNAKEGKGHLGKCNG